MKVYFQALKLAGTILCAGLMAVAQVPDRQVIDLTDTKYLKEPFVLRGEFVGVISAALEESGGTTISRSVAEGAIRNEGGFALPVSSNRSYVFLLPPGMKVQVKVSGTVKVGVKTFNLDPSIQRTDRGTIWNKAIASTQMSVYQNVQKGPTRMVCQLYATSDIVKEVYTLTLSVLSK